MWMNQKSALILKNNYPVSADAANQKREGARKPGASAERNFIFKVEKSLIHIISCDFSRFSNFSNFGWFWDDFAIIFDALA